MATSVEIEEISRFAAKIATIAASIGFVFLLSYGWHTTMRVIPFFNLYPWGSWIAGVAISIFALILAVFVATEHIRISRDKKAGSRYSWIVVFSILFFISAMGSINTFFLFTQGTTLVKEVVTSTNAKLVALDLVISTKVSTRSFDARKQALEERNTQSRNAFTSFVTRAKADIQEAQQEFEQRKRLAETAWEQFRAEYTNPLRIGWGEYSRKRYEELKAYLPDIRNPSGLEAVAGPAASSANANKVLEAFAINVAAQIRSTFVLDSIRCTISGDAAALYERTRELSGTLQPLPNTPTCATLTYFISSAERTLRNALEERVRLLQPSSEEARAVQFKAEAPAQIRTIIQENDKFVQESADLSFENARPILEKSWSNYARLYSALRQVIPADIRLDIPADIADSSVRNAGNIGNILSILATRLKEPQTYLIFFAALLIDFFLVGLLKRFFETELRADPPNIFNPPSNPLARS